MVMTGQVHETAASPPPDFRNRYICNPPAPLVRTLPGFISIARSLWWISARRTSLAQACRPLTQTIHPPASAGLADVMIVRVMYYAPVFAPFVALNGFVASGAMTGGQVMVDGQMPMQ